MSYLEGCTAPMRDENQLHAAVVELVALDDAEIKYSTVQNWYPGDENGKGGIYNFVTKRGDCRGERSKISWTQVETGSAITWKYPSLHPARRQFARRVLFDRHLQRPPAGRFRHQDDPSRQEHVEPHHLQGHRRRARGQHLSRAGLGAPPRPRAPQLHQLRLALLIGDKCGAHTVPYIEAKNTSAVFEHEATTSKISEDQLFYCRQRGMRGGGGGAGRQRLRRDVLQQLPMEFAVEAQKLIGDQPRGERRVSERRRSPSSTSPTSR